MNINFALLSTFLVTVFGVLATSVPVAAQNITVSEKMPVAVAAKKCKERIFQIAGNYLKEEEHMRLSINQHSLIPILNKTIEALEKRAEHQYQQMSLTPR